MVDDINTLRAERDALREIALYTRGLLQSFQSGRAAKRFKLDGMRGCIEEINWRAQRPQPDRTKR